MRDTRPGTRRGTDPDLPAQTLTYHLGADAPDRARLDANGVFTWAVGEFSGPTTFTFDPSDPTPTIGGRLLSPQGGYRDDSALAVRGDVAEFGIAGAMRCELHKRRGLTHRCWGKRDRLYCVPRGSA